MSSAYVMSAEAIAALASAATQSAGGEDSGPAVSASYIQQASADDDEAAGGWGTETDVFQDVKYVAPGESNRLDVIGDTSSNEAKGGSTHAPVDNDKGTHCILFLHITQCYKRCLYHSHAQNTVFPTHC